MTTNNSSKLVGVVEFGTRFFMGIIYTSRSSTYGVGHQTTAFGGCDSLYMHPNTRPGKMTTQDASLSKLFTAKAGNDLLVSLRVLASGTEQL